jgi:hypothetical protein
VIQIEPVRNNRDQDRQFAAIPTDLDQLRADYEAGDGSRIFLAIRGPELQ